MVVQCSTLRTGTKHKVVMLLVVASASAVHSLTGGALALSATFPILIALLMGLTAGHISHVAVTVHPGTTRVLQCRS